MSSLSFSPTVKICGLTRAEDVQDAISAGAGFLGFIVEANSPRRVSVSEAKPLFSPTKGLAKRVAVTVNADDHLLDRIARDLAPDFVQFHGDETVDRLAQISKRYDFGLIKAIPIVTDEDMKTAGEYAGIVDFVLFDAKPPKGSQVRGGHGVAIDWDIIARAPTPKTFALAGGLNPDTVREAISRTKAPILDVSSGVESAPGVKDVFKIQAFMKAVNSHG
ncbi:phosphoribosylanthranilate isomerase [Litorimonas haliclonae]|uniref:phosphoribosylanthranilate isomerase n=1 Tax=Litorimonas haliclonae TaxID=2081977 RepID=UPI0039EF9B3C